LYPWIYIVLLGAAAVLYAFMLPKRREESASGEQLVKEVEATLEGYMAEIQQENEQLVELIRKMKEEQSAKLIEQQEQAEQWSARIVELERKAAASEDRLRAAEDQLAKVLASVTEDRQAGAASNREAEPHMPSIKERYAELFEWYDQGKSIDMIAKASGMQRGEVQLIIQLARQEESV
jgi:septal ring factor EnvC (AmiA/AmiB activator)